MATPVLCPQPSHENSQSINSASGSTFMWLGRKIITTLIFCTPHWLSSLIQSHLPKNSSPRFSFRKLPIDAQLKVINCLAPPDAKSIFKTSKECRELEVEFLKGKTDALCQIVKNVQGNLSKLSKESRATLEKVGPTITKLDLNGFQLTVKMIKDIVKYFPNLQELSCAKAGLKESHISEIVKLKNLVRLDVSYSAISDYAVAKIAKLQDLTFLSVAFCQGISHRAIKPFTASSQLQGLSLEGCKNVSDQTLDDVVKLTTLSELNVGSNSKITQMGVGLLAALPRLTKLSLKSCLNINDDALKALVSFTQLKELDLSSCYSITNRGFQSVCDCKTLEKVTIAYLRITGEAFDIIEKLQKLKKLVIIGCLDLSNTFLEKVAKLTNLSELVIENCEGVTDAGLAQIATHPKLSGLSVAKANGVTGATLQLLAKAKQLEMLSLKRCKNVIDTDLPYLKEMKALKLLRLIACTQITERGKQYVKEMLPHIKLLDEKSTESFDF